MRWLDVAFERAAEVDRADAGGEEQCDDEGDDGKHEDAASKAAWNS